jgi:hypothetical protein
LRNKASCAGVTLTKPLTDGLVVDVPVLFQSQAQEPDLGTPPDDDRNMTRAQFTARLAKAFAKWKLVRNVFSVSLYAKRNIYQDRLGTNIVKVEKKKEAFAGADGASGDVFAAVR